MLLPLVEAQRLLEHPLLDLRERSPHPDREEAVAGAAPPPALPDEVSVRVKMTERSVDVVGQIGRLDREPARARTTARSTTFSSSRTLPGQR